MKTIEKLTVPISRREFLRLGLGSLAYIGAEAAGFAFSAERAKSTEHRVIPLLSQRLDPAWDNTVVVHLSDLHVSRRNVDFFTPNSAAVLTVDILQQLVALQADPSKVFLATTGDLVSHKTNAGSESSLDALKESLSFLSRIPAAQHFFVPGNHDLHHSKSQSIWEFCSTAGLTVLGLPGQNEYVYSDDSWPFLVVATTDFTSQQQEYTAPKVAQLEQQVTQEHVTGKKPHLWLTHNATVFDRVLSNPTEQLQHTLALAGHTHGGQVGANSPLQMLASYAALRRLGYTSQYMRGQSVVGESGLVGISSGLGHAGGQGIRTAQPQVVYYVLRSAKTLT